MLMNTDIKYLNLAVRHKDKEVIEMSDYDVTLQFIVHNRNNSIGLNCVVGDPRIQEAWWFIGALEGRVTTGVLRSQENAPP